jgi:hypothetical protein
MAIYTAALAWAEPSVLARVLPQIGQGWEDLEQYEVQEIVSTFQALITVSGSGRNAPKDLQKEFTEKLGGLPASLMCALYFRTKPDADPALIRNIERLYNNTEVDNHRSLVASVLCQYKTTTWNGSRPRLLEICKYYMESTTGNTLTTAGAPHHIPEMSNSDRRMILSAPFDYPASLLMIANVESTEVETKKVRPLREIALEEDWLDGLRY